MNEIEIYKCHLFVTLMMYYNSSKRKFEKKGKENIMEILRVEDLVKTYGKGENQVNAVDHISFSIDKGEFVAIVGASGSGKSTLLHLLGGVDRPTSGKVFIDGKDIYSLNDDNLAIFRRRQIGLIYQFYNLIPILNVRENITLPCDLDGQKVDEKRLDELIKTLGLEKREKHLPNQLSGGQQQMLALCRGLMCDPKIILLDEPSLGLAPVIVDEVFDKIREINEKKGISILLVEQNAYMALEASLRCYVLENGVVKLSGNSTDLAENESVKAVYLGG